MKIKHSLLMRITIVKRFWQVKFGWKTWPYPGIAPGGYSIHYTNTNPNPYPGANPG